MGGIVGIVGFSIRNWRMTIGIMIFAVIGGLLALDRLPLDAEPDIPVPFVNVRVVLPGISPEDAERLLIRPLETEIKSIEGVKTIDSVAATNVAYVIIEFDISHDQDKALTDVLEKRSFHKKPKSLLLRKFPQQPYPLSLSIFGVMSLKGNYRNALKTYNPESRACRKSWKPAFPASV